jgi:hypothetical protein
MMEGLYWKADGYPTNQEIPCFYGTWGFPIMSTIVQYWTQLNLIFAFTSHLSKLYFNIILPYVSKSPCGTFPSGLKPNFYTNLSITMHATHLAHFFFLYFISQQY